MENINLICQAWIMVCGCAAVWLVGRLEEWRRWGYIFGLALQPAMIYSASINEQWGIVGLSAWCSYSWSQGVYNYWIRTSNKGKYHVQHTETD